MRNRGPTIPVLITGCLDVWQFIGGGYEVIGQRWVNYRLPLGRCLVGCNSTIGASRRLAASNTASICSAGGRESEEGPVRVKSRRLRDVRGPSGHAPIVAASLQRSEPPRSARSCPSRCSRSVPPRAQRRRARVASTRASLRRRSGVKRRADSQPKLVNLSTLPAVC